MVKAQTVETLAATGVGTWICPPGVTSVIVECWGGGGAGGAAKNTTGGNSARGGGGTGSGYSKATIAVKAGTPYNYLVGAGGLGAVLTDDYTVAASGTNSYFIDATTVNAPGGNGGIGRLCGTSQTNGAGVTYTPTTTAVGDVGAIWNGGNGGAAAGSTSGSGGGSGGTGSNGNNASTTAVTGGGAGGAGKSGAGNGNNGGIPGGGGAGAKADAKQNMSGGNGGNGKIIITLNGFTTIATGTTFTVAARENLTIPSGTTFTVASGGTLNVAVGGTITNNGTITNDGTLTVNGTISNIGTAVVDGTGTFDLNSGATINVSHADGLNSTTGAIRCTTRNFNSAANYVFNGAAAQVSGADFPATVNNLTINSVAGVTLSDNLTVNGTILIMTTSYIRGSGDFTLSAGATINTTSALGLNATTGPIRCTGTRTFSTSANYTFNGTVAQVPGTDFPATVNNLTISNSTGVTLSAPLTVNGILTLTSGALTNGANLTLGNSASIVRAGGSLGTAPTFGTNKDITYSGTSTITAGVELPAEATSLTVSNTAGVTLSSALTVSGATSITGKLILGNTLTANSALTVGAAGTLQFNDVAALAGSGAVTYTSGGTLAFNKTSGTTISGSETYWPLSNGPSNVSVLQNTLTLDVNRVISDTASVSTGATLITNTNKQLTVGTFANAGIILNMGTLTGSSTGAGFIVNVAANDNTKGSVTGSITGADVSLTAIPASGNYFVNWTEAPTGEIGTAATLPAFTLSANRTIVANFSVITDLNNAMTYVFASVENRKVFINGEVNAIKIFNAQGKLVYAKNQTVNYVSLPTSGIYIVKMHTPAGIKIQKLSVM